MQRCRRPDRNDELTAKEEHEDRVTGKQGVTIGDKPGVALGDKPGLALQHKDDEQMCKHMTPNGMKTRAQAMFFGWLGDSSWINDGKPATKSTSTSSIGSDNLKGDAEGTTKQSGQRLKMRGTSSCPAGNEPSTLNALQLLARGVTTGCALSAAAWAQISKLKKDEVKGAIGKAKAAALKKAAAMKKRKAAAVA